MSEKFAIVSSGDPEQDRKGIAAFERRDELIRHGNCPNGCGGMIQADAHNTNCPKCGFGYFSNAPLKLKGRHSDHPRT